MITKFSEQLYLKACGLTEKDLSPFYIQMFVEDSVLKIQLETKRYNEKLEQIDVTPQDIEVLTSKSSFVKAEMINQVWIGLFDFGTNKDWVLELSSKLGSDGLISSNNNALIQDKQKHIGEVTKQIEDVKQYLIDWQANIDSTNQEIQTLQLEDQKTLDLAQKAQDLLNA